jgi:hypothetical protein
MRQRLPRLLVESAMIILSVLLALAADGWADARKERQVGAQARATFVHELTANRARVSAALPYHEALMAAVFRVDSSDATVVPSYEAWRRQVPIWSGFAPPDLVTTAWQSALTTGALGRMPYAEVAALSRAYTMQGKLDAFTAAYLPLFDFSDPAMRGTVRRMNVYMQTVLTYEHALLREYELALRALDATVPVLPPASVGPPPRVPSR